MTLARAGEDEEGDMVATEERHEVHVEFSGWLTNGGQNVFDER